MTPRNRSIRQGGRWILAVVAIAAAAACTGQSSTPSAKPRTIATPGVPVAGDLVAPTSGLGSRTEVVKFVVKKQAQLYFACSGGGTATVTFSPFAKMNGVACSGAPIAAPILGGPGGLTISVGVHLRPENPWTLTVSSTELL